MPLGQYIDCDFIFVYLQQRIACKTNVKRTVSVTGAARFVKGRYGMFESVMQMLEQLTGIPLSKRCKNSRLILFNKIINNLTAVPHSCLEEADVLTRKNHSQKFRYIGYNVDPYGQ